MTGLTSCSESRMILRDRSCIEQFLRVPRSANLLPVRDGRIDTLLHVLIPLHSRSGSDETAIAENECYASDDSEKKDDEAETAEPVTPAEVIKTAIEERF